MKYFLDTEFLEGPQKEKFPISLFRKQTPNTIDLISIGIVAEDGREYYAISKDFNLKEAWNRFQLEEQSGDMRNIFPEGKKVYWLRENVLKPIWRDLFFQADDCSGLSNKQTEAFYQGVLAGEYDQYFTFKSMKALIDKFGKTNKQIAEEIKRFTTKAKFEANENGRFCVGTDFKDNITKGDILWDKPEFYAYYADYDWVVFCWLFGKMMDLPDGFPMYCKDLKQMLDEYALNAKFADNSIQGMNLNNRLIWIKGEEKFPKQDPSKSHNAIDDARWNKKLFDFLNKL